MTAPDCSEIRDRLRAGSVPSGPEVSAHAATCPQCAELLRDDARLGRALSDQASLAVEARALQRIETALAREVGVRAWLRSRATGLRIALALAGLLPAVTVGVVRHGSELHLSTVPSLWLLAFVAPIPASLAVLLRSRGRPPVPAAVLGLLGLGLMLPVVFALVPSSGLQVNVPASTPSTGGCFLYGLALALPFVALAWAIDRGDRPSLLAALLTGAIGGLIGNIALFLHCPHTEPWHLLAAHAPIGAALALLLVTLRAPPIRPDF
jgi:hypothetical protein